MEATNTKPMYAMYLRKSRADLEAEALGEGETLARHKNILFKLAEKHDILLNQIVIYQEVVSGDSISARPEMQRLLNDVYQRKYKGVLVVEVERLARGNTKDQGEVADAFQYSGTHIITPVKTYDPNNEFDQEYFEFGLFMSRREYKTIKRRMEAGRLESIAEGNYVGSIRPYGYDILRKNKKERILVEKPEESRYVKLMFNWFTHDRLSAGQIARKLTEMHVPTMTGNSEWNRATVKDILQNIHYTGKVRWNRRRCSKEYDTGTGALSRTKRRLTPDDYMIYEGKHEGFISKEQFDFAQTLFSGQVPVKVCETVINPFAGLLRCAKCGKTISYADYKDKPTTEPRYLHAESMHCKLKSLRASVVTGAIVESLENHISDLELKLADKSENEEVLRRQDVLAALQAELDRQEKKRQRLFDAFEEGVYDSSEFIERKQICNGVIEEIKKQIQVEKSKTPESVDYQKEIIKLHEAIDCIQASGIDAKSKNNTLKSFIDYIDYDVEDYGRQKGGKPILNIHLK